MTRVGSVQCSVRRRRIGVQQEVGPDLISTSILKPFASGRLGEAGECGASLRLRQSDDFGQALPDFRTPLNLAD